MTFCKYKHASFWIQLELIDLYPDVVTGDEAHSKATLEAMIKENGGTFMQQARNTQYVVAGTESKHGFHCLQDAV